MNKEFFQVGLDLVKQLTPLIAKAQAVRRRSRAMGQVKKELISQKGGDLLIDGTGQSKLPEFNSIQSKIKQGEQDQHGVLKEVETAVATARNTAREHFGKVIDALTEEAKAKAIAAGKPELAEQMANECPQVQHHRSFIEFLNDKSHEPLTVAYQIVEHCEIWLEQNSKAMASTPETATQN